MIQNQGVGELYGQYLGQSKPSFPQMVYAHPLGSPLTKSARTELANLHKKDLLTLFAVNQDFLGQRENHSKNKTKEFRVPILGMPKWANITENQNLTSYNLCYPQPQNF